MRCLGSALPVLACLVCIVFAGNSLAAPDLPSTADLFVRPGDIMFFPGTFAIESMYWTTPGNLVDIVAVVNNAGPDESPAANATFFLDGALLASVPVPAGITPNANASVEFNWDTTGASLGHHAIRVAVSSATDPDLSNDNATADFSLAELPALEISLDNPVVRVANSGPPYPEATFTGRVTINRTSDVDMKVLLLANTEGYTTVVLDPQTLVFGGTVRSLNFTMFVKPVWSWGTGRQVRLDAQIEGTTDISASASTEATVAVAPFYHATLTPGGETFDVWPGQTVKFDFYLWNEGSLYVAYSLTVANKDELADEGWNVTVSPVYTDMGPNERDTVTVTAVPTKDWPPLGSFGMIYDYTRIRVNVSLYINATNTIHAGQNVDFYLRREGFYAPSTAAVTLTVISLTIIVTLVAIRRAGNRKEKKGSRVGLFIAGVTVFSIGLWFLLMSLSLSFAYTAGKSGLLTFNSGMPPGIQTAIFFVPLMLEGTAIGAFLVADGRVRYRIRPYLVIMAIEATILLGSVPYAQNYLSNSYVQGDSGQIMIEPIFSNPGPAFLLLLVLLFLLGLSFWYLFRPDSWPLRKIFPGADNAKPPH